MKLKRRSVDVTHASSTNHANLSPQPPKIALSCCRQEPRPGREAWEESLFQKPAHGGSGDVQRATSRGVFPCTVALAASVHPLTGRAVGFLRGKTPRDPCWTWGEHPNFCLHCWHLCKGWAQKGEALLSALLSTGRPAPSRVLAPRGAGLHHHPIFCPCHRWRWQGQGWGCPWQSITLCSPEPCSRLLALSLFAHVSWKWNFQLVFSPLKIDRKQLSAIQLNY